MDKPKRKYDAPKEGYQRFTAYVSIKLVNDFKKIANLEQKTFSAALEEAIQNWTYTETDND
jgi:hypothetical protein